MTGRSGNKGECSIISNLMTKKESNKRSNYFFIGISVLAFVFFWLGVFSIPWYIDYVFLGKQNADTPPREALRSHARDRQSEDSVKDPFITRNPQAESRQLTEPEIRSSDPSLGDTNSPVTIVQFSDFKCEFCHRQEKVIQDLRKEYKNKIRLIWKDYPENDPDSISWRASRAAACAQKQGSFWKYHDLLYQSDKKMGQDLFMQLASRADLDLVQFKKCLKKEKVDHLIEQDIQEANSLRISGIPFLYINNQEIMGALDKESLKRIIEIELKEED